MKETNHGDGASQELPSILDISPSNGVVLEERWAVKNFHGLNLAQAAGRLRENPLHYLEDLEWMGPRGFAFYAPALRTVVVEGGLGEPGDGEWDSVISMVSRRMEAGCLPLGSVMVMRDCLESLTAQLAALENWPGEHARMARKLERVSVKLAVFPEWGGTI